MTGKSFSELKDEDRRLVLLLLLHKSDAYSANAYLLQDALPGFGHNASLDRVKADLAWLAEQSLLETRDIGGVLIATLHARGVDVALGRATCPGIKRPLPD